MIRTSAVLASVVALALLISGCTSPEENASSSPPGARPAAAPSPPPVSGTPGTGTGASEGIKIVEGTRYYIGGVTTARDRYNRSRTSGFRGEVLSPPSKGLVFGRRELPDGKIEISLFVNGELDSRTVGFLDEQGLVWELRTEWYLDGGISRTLEYAYDDEAEQVHLTSTRIDPKNGEVIAVTGSSEPYQKVVEPPTPIVTSTTSTTSTTLAGEEDGQPDNSADPAVKPAAPED